MVINTVTESEKGMLCSREKLVNGLLFYQPYGGETLYPTAFRR